METTFEIMLSPLLDKEEEYRVADCENCGEEGWGRAWYGKGEATGDAWGDRYYATGSVVLCKECWPKNKREWNGEECWKWTSDREEHTAIRENAIKEKNPGAKERNELRLKIREKFQSIVNEEV